MQENADQKNSEYWHFLHSAYEYLGIKADWEIFPILFFFFISFKINFAFIYLYETLDTKLLTRSYSPSYDQRKKSIEKLIFTQNEFLHRFFFSIRIFIFLDSLSLQSQIKPVRNTLR